MMADSTQHNLVFLSGGGDEHQTFPLDNFFLEHIQHKGKILYIPIALRGHKLYQNSTQWFKDVLRLHNRPDITIETCTDLSNYNSKYLNLFDAIYIGGGNTWNLIYEVRESNFDKILTDFIQSKGIIYGGSAGAIILGDYIDTHDDVNERQIQDINGLSLLNQYSLACHYSPKNYERFKMWALNKQTPILALPETSGLVVHNMSSTCIGTDPCMLFSKQGMVEKITPGEKISL